MLCRIGDYKKKLDNLTKVGALSSPHKIFSDRKLKIDVLWGILNSTFKDRISKSKEKFLLFVGKLDALSPLKLISSGYCVAINDSGMIINKIDSVKGNEKIKVIVSDGEINCNVRNVSLGGFKYAKK